MKNKKIPMRSCVVTKEKLPKQELLRVVRTPEGTIIVDDTLKANGRGCYLKRLRSYKKAETSKVLDRHLETKIPLEIYDILKEKI